MEKFDKQNLQEIREAIDQALLNVKKTFGIDIKLGNISYTDNSFKAKLEAFIGSKVDNLAATYKTYKDMLGLPEINAHLKDGYKIIGLDMSKHTKRIILEKDGKRYKTDLTHLKLLLIN